MKSFLIRYFDLIQLILGLFLVVIIAYLTVKIYQQEEVIKFQIFQIIAINDAELFINHSEIK